jgi:hypothetical protein
VYPADVLRRRGGHVDLDAIEAEAVDLWRKDPAEAERFFGNMIRTATGKAVDAAKWKAAARPDRIVADGERIGLGFDGSISEDTTALVACTADGYVFVPEVDYGHGLMPTVWERPAGVDEWRVPRLEVEDALEEIMRRWDVGRMYADPPKWTTELERWAERYNLDDDEPIVAAFDTNQLKAMGYACDRFLTGLAELVLTHDATPVLSAHVLAMARKKAHLRADENDGRTLYVFVKGESGHKIDVGIAAVLAYEAALTMPESGVVELTGSLMA